MGALVGDVADLESMYCLKMLFQSSIGSNNFDFRTNKTYLKQLLVMVEQMQLQIQILIH